MRGGRIGGWLLVALLLPAAATAPAGAQTYTGNVNFMPGVKMLDEDDWTPVEDQTALGISWSYGKRTWPIHMVIDYLFSFKSETQESDQFGTLAEVETDAITAEVGFGIQKTWDAGRFHPYLAGGACVVFAQAKLDAGGSGLRASETLNDVAPGGWIGGGFFVRAGPRFNIGLAARWSKAEATFDSLEAAGGPGITIQTEEIDVEAGGFHAALLLGVGYPARR